jgi:hypothetical protein
MTDHLTRLAARALGLAETVRPRQTLFAPQPGVPEQVARSEPEVEQPPSAPTAEPAAQAETVVVNPERREVAPRPEAAEPIAADEPEHVATPLVETRPADARPVRSEPAASLPERGERPGHALARKEPVADVRPPADSRVEHVAKVFAQRLPLLSTRPRHRSLPPEREPEQAPTVRVTIGRVDVKAIAPERPVERRPPKQAPRMSLDEYLSRNRSTGR